LQQEIDAWQRAADLLRLPDRESLALGLAELDAHRPRQALRSFDRADSISGSSNNNIFLAKLAHGRAVAWSELGDLDRAISFQEKTVKLAPDRADYWLELADLYERQQRMADAQRARQHAAAIPNRPE